MTPINDTNAVRSQFRATNKHTNYGLVALWVLLLVLGFLMISNNVFATIFTDDFETYTTGTDLGSQVNWDCNYSFDFQPIISENRAYSGIKSVENKYVNNQIPSFCWRFGDITFTGNQQVWFYISSGIIGDIIFHQHPYIQLKFDNANNLIKYYDENLNWTTLTTFNEWNNWVVFSVEWRLVGEFSEYRYSFNGGNFTEWQKPQELLNVNRSMVEWHTRNQSGYFYFDTFEATPENCSIQTCNFCYTEYSCFLSGCNWNSETETCESKPYGTCGIENYLRFCDIQFECEALGGYWVADFCWEIEPPEITNWDIYYSEHSDFDTPTNLTTSLVNLTEPIMETAGGWLVSMESIFDTAEATQKGEQFGEAIPIARGYLATINEFFGGFPISEAFIFFLIITLAIGVFRIVRNIILLVKPF